MVTNDEIIFTNEPPFIDDLEWEGLQKKYEIGKHGPIDSEMIPKESNKIEIFRENEYKIKGKLYGIFEDRDELKILNPLEEVYLKILNLGTKYEIKCSFNNISNGYNQEKGHYFNSDIDVSYIKRNYDLGSNKNLKEYSNVSWLTEWFLNGPKSLRYGGSISYSLCKKYNKWMKEPEYPILGLNHKLHNDFYFNLEKGIEQKYYQRGSHSKPYMFVEFKDMDNEDKYFTIQSVPDSYGPSWSNKVSIEYKSDWWIPTPEERKKINEIVSFSIGRQLVSIGYTKYNRKGGIIEDCCYSPQISEGIHFHDLCKADDITPINQIQGNRWADNISTHLKQLIPNYLNLRDKLNLHEVLGKYWLSQAVPKEAEIIVLAACLESLINSCYSSPKYEREKEYMSETKFNEYLMCELKSIKIKMEKVDFGDRILRKIENSYRMGGNESFDFFFKEVIGLNVGKIERKAIKYRNSPVHGNILVQGSNHKTKDYEKMLQMTNAYLTLVNRTILKILGYDNEYIDFYRLLSPFNTLKDIVRPIDEPVTPLENVDPILSKKKRFETF